LVVSKKEKSWVVLGKKSCQGCAGDGRKRSKARRIATERGL